MDSKALLDQLLQAGQTLAKQGLEAAQGHLDTAQAKLESSGAQEKLAQGQAIAKEKLTQGQAIAQEKLAQGQAILKEKLAQGQAIAEEKLGIPGSGAERDAMLSGLGKGAAAAGAVAILLGTRLGRRMTGAAVKVGTVAAIGKLGVDAYRNWQATQGSAIAAGQPIGELPEAEANQRSLALLKAMIAAAKADGHMDAAERATIQAQIQEMGLTTATAEILQSEMEKSLDAGAIAQLADSPAAAVEMYLVSRLVVDIANDAERAYLADLANALQLAPDLVNQLEAQAIG